MRSAYARSFLPFETKPSQILLQRLYVLVVAARDIGRITSYNVCYTKLLRMHATADAPMLYNATFLRIGRDNRNAHFSFTCL